nr:hypothetical protein [Mycobacterium sp. E3298]
MEFVYVISALVFIIVVTLGIKYAKEKNIISDSDISVVTDVISIAKNVISDLDLNEKTKTSISTVLDISDSVSDYVHNLSSAVNVEDKEGLALDVVNKILSILRIPVSDKDKGLIAIVIHESIKYLEGKDLV